MSLLFPYSPASPTGTMITLFSPVTPESGHHHPSRNSGRSPVPPSNHPAPGARLSWPMIYWSCYFLPQDLFMASHPIWNEILIPSLDLNVLYHLSPAFPSDPITHTSLLAQCLLAVQHSAFSLPKSAPSSECLTHSAFALECCVPRSLHSWLLLVVC